MLAESKQEIKTKKSKKKTAKFLIGENKHMTKKKGTKVPRKKFEEKKHKNTENTWQDKLGGL